MKKKPKAKPKKNTFLEKLPKNHGEWLFLCIKFTKRSLTQPDSPSQKFLVRQLVVLENELSAWEHGHPLVHIRDVFELIKR